MTDPYPLRVAFLGGRVRHVGRYVPNSNFVTTACGKRDVPVGNGARLAVCAACAKRPNPISQQTRSA